jgi:hypothetical protein
VGVVDQQKCPTKSSSLPRYSNGSHDYLSRGPEKFAFTARQEHVAVSVILTAIHRLIVGRSNTLGMICLIIPMGRLH